MTATMTSPTAAQPFPIREGEFIAMMAAIQALQALAIDVMLPGLGLIAHDLGVDDPNQRQLVIGVFLLGGGLGSLFPGAFADRYGRRPVVLLALAVFVVMSVGCAFVRDFNAMIALRAIQGFLGGALAVVPMAVIRDRFSGDRMARAQSLIAMAFMVAPMVAPILGQVVLEFAGWRWIFGITAVLGLATLTWTWLRLPETLHPEFRQEIRPRAIAANMRVAVSNRAATGYFVGAALLQGTMFGYINSSQQLVGEALGAGTWFPAIFAWTALVMAATNFTNSRIVEAFGARRVSQTALIAFILLAGAHWVVAKSGQSLTSFVVLISLTMCMMSFIGANFGAIALQPFARLAGAAASAQSFVRMVMSAGMGMVIGQMFDGTAAPLTAAMVIAGLLTLFLVLHAEQGRLFRRLHYPGKP